MNTIKSYAQYTQEMTEGITESHALATTNTLVGGRGDKLTPEEVDPKELEVGIEVEREHVNKPELAQEIALDHLAENPHYYSDAIRAGLVDEEPALALAREFGWEL